MQDQHRYINYVDYEASKRPGMECNKHRSN